MEDPTSTVSRVVERPTGHDGDLEVPRLFVVFECRRPFAPALRLTLAEVDDVAIGRGPSRSWTRVGRRLELQICDHEISRNHVRLQHREDGWELVDLESKNGTSVNGARGGRPCWWMAT